MIVYKLLYSVYIYIYTVTNDGILNTMARVKYLMLAIIVVFILIKYLAIIYSGPKCCHHSQTCRAQSALNPFHTWYMLLTGLHRSSVVSIPLLLPSNSSIPPLHPLRARELRAIVIITGRKPKNK